MATVIYYLSYAKEKIQRDPQNQKYPSSHLNAILIQTKKSDAPNKPQYIRHKRRKSIYVQKETDSLSSSTFTSDMSSDDETNIKNTTVKKTKKKKIDSKDKTNGYILLNTMYLIKETCKKFTDTKNKKTWV